MNITSTSNTMELITYFAGKVRISHMRSQNISKNIIPTYSRRDK
jgi:hypothetical protein